MYNTFIQVNIILEYLKLSHSISSFLTLTLNISYLLTWLKMNCFSIELGSGDWYNDDLVSA